MSKEVKTLSFTNNPEGQRKKTEAIKNHLENGWELLSESVTSSSQTFKTDQAALESTTLCCVCGPICAPLGALGKSSTTQGAITITLAREQTEGKEEEGSIQTSFAIDAVGFDNEKANPQELTTKLLILWYVPSTITRMLINSIDKELPKYAAHGASLWLITSDNQKFSPINKKIKEMKDLKMTVFIMKEEEFARKSGVGTFNSSGVFTIVNLETTEEIWRNGNALTAQTQLLSYLEQLGC